MSETDAAETAVPTPTPSPTPSAGGRWFEVGSVADLERRKKVVVEPEDHPILVLVHDGAWYAFDNLCIHKQREMSKGVILRDKLVCPGHQWAFELATGWEAIKERCQPTHAVRVVDGTVQIDLDCAGASLPPPSTPS